MRAELRGVFSDRVRAPRDRNSCMFDMQHRTPSFDTEQCAMEFCFLARDDRSNVNTITTNESTR
jgi:hypothetical protein